MPTETRPEPQPMTRDEMAAWLCMRGVVGKADLDRNLDQYAGKTEDEMDALYDSMHGSMA